MSGWLISSVEGVLVKREVRWQVYKMFFDCRWSFRLWAVTAFSFLLGAASTATAQYAAPQQAAKPIKSLPAVISSPGIYVLGADLAFGATVGTAIQISGSGKVTIDLAGHTLSDSGDRTTSNTAVGIAASNVDADVTVCNGLIKGFQVAVNVGVNGNTQRCVVSDLTVIESGRSAISLSGNVLEVRNCLLSETGFDSSYSTVGIYLSGNQTAIRNCRILGFAPGGAGSEVAIQLNAYQSGVVEGNWISSRSSDCIGILASGNQNFVRENRISHFTTPIQFSGAGKYAGNMTVDCANAVSGGTAVGTQND